MKTLHIILPMGGEGSRFKNIGINTPKPLIEANGKMFFVRALDSLLQTRLKEYDIKITAIVRKEHIINDNIDSALSWAVPNINIKSVEKTTRGTVETCMLANIADDEAVIVLDCDLEFSCEDYVNHIIDVLEEKKNESALLSFYSDKTKYSYAQVDGNGYVTETAEKMIISNNALVGAYFFENGKKFKEAAEWLMNDKKNSVKEMYTSLLYNFMIAFGHKVKLYKANKHSSFGTPEELEVYEQLNKTNHF